MKIVTKLSIYIAAHALNECLYWWNEFGTQRINCV
jgi:hypothetical protein